VKFTNKYNLPDAFRRAVENDPYSKGDSDFSATSLLVPPRAIVLIERFQDALEIDISSRVAIIIGQGTHWILERARRPKIDITETRYFGRIHVNDKTYTVSAQIDLFESDTGILSDWKTTKAFAFSKRAAPKREWEAQLNIGAYLFSSSTGIDVKGLRIIGLLKDWNSKKAKMEAGYPETELMSLDIEQWTEDRTIDFIRNKIILIENARQALPQCSSEETWGGNRCQNWCDAAQVCEQWQKAKKTGLIMEKK
jgi:hypothetical protein